MNVTPTKPQLPPDDVLLSNFDYPAIEELDPSLGELKFLCIRGRYGLHMTRANRCENLQLMGSSYSTNAKSLLSFARQLPWICLQRYDEQCNSTVSSIGLHGVD